MRALVKNGFTKAATLSRRTGREVLGMTRIKSPINIPAAGASSTTSESIEESKKSSARRLPSVETEASGTGSSQTWEDCGKFFLNIIIPSRPLALVPVVILSFLMRHLSGVRNHICATEKRCLLCRYIKVFPNHPCGKFSFSAINGMYHCVTDVITKNHEPIDSMRSFWFKSS